MELKDIYFHIKRNLRGILLTGVVFAFFGLLIHNVVPHRYWATGTFFVARSVEEDSQDFQYEGFYANQTALNYARSITFLLESKDLRSKALKLIDIPVTERSLRELNRNIRIKHSNTQFVTLSARGETPQEAENIWGSMSNVLLNSVGNLNEGVDSKISIKQVSTEPIIESSFKSRPLNILVGFVLGVLFATLLSGLVEYLRGEKNQ